MSDDKTIEYYADGDSAWVFADKLDYRHDVTKISVNIDNLNQQRLGITRTSSLLAYAAAYGLTVKNIGEIVHSKNGGTRIVRYDDGKPETPTEERIAHPIDHIVVAPITSAYVYMTLHAADAGLVVCGGSDENHDNMYDGSGSSSTLSFTEQERDFYTLEEITRKELETYSIIVNSVIGESYEAIEGELDARLARAKDALHRDGIDHGDGNNDDSIADSDDEPAASEARDEDSRAHGNGDNAAINAVSLDDAKSLSNHMAVIALDGKTGTVSIYRKPETHHWYDDAGVEYDVVGAQLVDDAGHVLLTKTTNSESVPREFNPTLDDGDESIVSRAVLYRELRRGYTNATYELNGFDPLLPQTISVAAYEKLSDFMKDKYYAGSRSAVESHIDYKIISRAYSSVDSMVEGKPVSGSLGKLIREALGYNEYDAAVNVSIGSVVAHNSLWISVLGQPYDGSTEPRYSYSINGRRSKKPSGRKPSLPDRKWTLAYDDTAWPFVYGRSHEALLEQARSVLAAFDGNADIENNAGGNDDNDANEVES